MNACAKLKLLLQQDHNMHIILLKMLNLIIMMHSSLSQAMEQSMRASTELCIDLMPNTSYLTQLLDSFPPEIKMVYMLQSLIKVKKIITFSVQPLLLLKEDPPKWTSLG
jgi:hypothetical protein